MGKIRKSSCETTNRYLRNLSIIFNILAFLFIFGPNQSKGSDNLKQALNKTFKNLRDIPRPLRVPLDAVSGNRELPQNQYRARVIHLFKERKTLGYDVPEEFLALDPDKDGQFTDGELEGLADQAFAFMDSNHDAYLSKSEIMTVQHTFLFYHHCKVKSVTSGMHLIHIGSGRGTAISTVRMVGDSQMITTINIDIPLHVGPLYLVLTGDSPIIWRLMGNTQAVHHVAITRSENGVLGISKEKVEFIEETCFSNSLPDGKWFDGLEGDLAIRELVGKHPDLSGWETRVGTVFVKFKELVFQTSKDRNPGGWATIPKGFHPKVWGGYANSWAYPDGVAVIDPTQVISSKGEAFEVYEVLSGLLKLNKLVLDGVIKRGGRFSNVVRILKDNNEISWSELRRRIVILPQGMKIPEGISKEKCILREKTGEVLAGKNCFSDGIIREHY